MKLIHTGDLHIGKVVNGFSMLEEQRHALGQILALAEKEAADAVILAGDIYDRAVPPKEGVQLFDYFLGRLTEMEIPVLAVAGNHDSPERLGFGALPLKRQGICLAGPLKETPECVSFSDAWGTVKVHLLPFAGAAAMREVYGGQAETGTAPGESGLAETKIDQEELTETKIDQEELTETKIDQEELTETKIDQEGQKESGADGDRQTKPNTTLGEPRQPEPNTAPGSAPAPEQKPSVRGMTLSEAAALALARIDTSDGARHILVTHHFVGDGGVLPETCDSETKLMAGGIDLIEASLFDRFDYTALGHLHGAQKIGNGPVYYSGSPVKYSFSEVNQKKSVWVVELKEKGNCSVKRHSLTPLHDMRVIRGPLSELKKPEVYGAADREDYLCVRLTDEGELYQPAEVLRGIYPNLMQLVLEKNLPPEEAESTAVFHRERRTPEELFADFFFEVTGREADAARMEVAREAFARAGREEQDRAR